MRKEGWEKHLNTYILESSHRKFEWGVFDCVVFVSNWILDVTGIDVMSKKYDDDIETGRGIYRNESEAMEIVKKHRGAPEGIMDAHFDRIDLGFSLRGDVVMWKDGAFGIATRNGEAMFNGVGVGIQPRPVAECQYAWRIE